MWCYTVTVTIAIAITMSGDEVVESVDWRQWSVVICYF